ncbi:MAG: aminotransferase class I/II-fold pyridoxal phosphate-dependent enzyme [Oscillospiraceae bacterium]|nr:aminotransferase class I/II-fold pyridoxal phosphate-dependent enzyme [Oscillospiraceae bacterium]
MEKRIFLSPPDLTGKEIDFLREALDTNWVAPAGPHIAAFELELCSTLCGYAAPCGYAASCGYAAPCGVAAHACALSSGTAALHLTLLELGVGDGDTVFVSDLTFAGSVNPILYCGATPVFIDAAPDGCNMDPAALERAFATQPRPKAVVIVDLYGIPADYDRLLPLCASHGVPVIEDAAEALGATYKGKSCGLFGAFGVFSFNGNKIITTSGGGMAVAADADAIRHINFRANQAKEPAPYYLHKELGYNYRMSNLLAGVGRAQLASLPDKIARRKAIYERYRAAFADLPLTLLPIPAGCAPNYWLSVAVLSPEAPLSAAALTEQLEGDNIEARRIWNPMHRQPVFADYPRIIAGRASNADELFENGICLPSGSSLTEEEQGEIISRVCDRLS